MGNALGQPFPVGLLEVLEEDVGVVHVVDPPRLVRRGRQLVKVSHPPLNLQSRKLDQELPFFMQNALSLAVNVDPAFYLNADPDTGSQTNADPDSDLGQTL